MILRGLSEYSQEEKIKVFDKLYGLAENCLFDRDEDNKQWCFEAVMELLAKDKRAFWDLYNRHG